jgi:hypothetical protein
VKVSEDELYGRIIKLALEGFFDEWRNASDVASELLRRGWAPKNFKHVRPALEHLVALEVLERERKPGRKAKWLYRKTEKLGERVTMMERGGDSPTDKQGPYAVIFLFISLLHSISEGLMSGRIINLAKVESPSPPYLY